MARPALVLGGSNTIWGDLRRASMLLANPVVIAVNAIGAHYPERIDHWVTLHPENLLTKGWVAERAANGWNNDYETWSRREPGFVDHCIGHWGTGSSGLFGVTVAYELGCPRVVLAGVTIDERPHFNRDEPWGEYEIHRPGWERHYMRMEGRVKSLSGWTRDLLGAPTRHWLQSEEAA